MSFILDALRKAERERKWARVPTLETVHAAPVVSRRHRWPWLAGAALAVIVGAGVALVGPRSGAPPAPAAPPSPPAPPPAARSSAPSVVPAAPTPAIAAAPATPAPRPEPASVPAAVAAVPTPPTPRPLPQARAPELPRPAAPEPPSRLAGASPAPAAVLVAPEPVARAAEPAPPLTLNALVYSDDPAERLVFINGRKYLEGQTVDGGAVVERITRDGVELSAQGRRIVLR